MPPLNKVCFLEKYDELSESVTFGAKIELFYRPEWTKVGTTWIYFFRIKCLQDSFLYLKMFKIHFPVVPPLLHSGL